MGFTTTLEEFICFSEKEIKILISLLKSFNIYDDLMNSGKSQIPYRSKHHKNPLDLSDDEYEEFLNKLKE